MKSYHISRSLGSPIRSHSKVVRATIYAVVLVIYLILRRRFQWVWIFFVLMYALLSYLFPIETPDYDLEIDGDGIRIVQGGEVKRVLPRDRIKYVREWKTGNKLVISEHGPIWTRLFWGGISVPKDLPGYEEIKAQALSLLPQRPTIPDSFVGSNP